MQWSRRAAAFFGALAIAGCSSAAPAGGLGAGSLDPSAIGAIRSSPPPLVRKGPKAHGWLSPAAKRGYLVYVADGNAIMIFPERGVNPKPVGEITDGIESAYGLYVDRSGNLYVCNQYGNNVEVYAPGSTTPSRTYTEDLQRPLYPIVDGKGSLYVGNADNGTVVVYPRGSTTPSEVLHTDGSEADGMDFDTSGNLYVAYRTYYSYYGTGGIEVFPKGSTQGHEIGISLDQPQGLIVTNNGTILAVQTGYGQQIDVFAPGTTTPSLQLQVPYTPTQMAITQAERNLRVSTLSPEGYVYGIVYPLVGPNGEPHPLRERDEGGTNIVQGLALSNGQYFKY
jgi:hypothetical protein